MSTSSPPGAAWLRQRMFPLLATVGLIAFGMGSTVWWGPHLVGRATWSVPDDLWGTMVAAGRLLHGDLAGLYTRPTALVSFPGAAVAVAPVVAVIRALGVPLLASGHHSAHPGAWLLAGPYAVAVSAVALFAADAIAGFLGVTRRRRALLAAAGAVALWNVSVRWGHPEDAVAVGTFLYGALALARGKVTLAGWLTGAAVAVQPLVLLALPVALVMVPARRLAGFLARAAVPAALLVGAAAVANWHAAVRAMASQPNWPAVDHPAPWVAVAPHLADGAVAAGPARVIAILVACGCAVAAGWRWRASRDPAQAFGELLWWMAAALAVRCVLEPVMVAFYLWPALAVALIAASVSWVRLAAVSFAATALTLASQVSWGGRWGWWAAMIAGLAVALTLAGVPWRRPPAAEALSPQEPGVAAALPAGPTV